MTTELNSSATFIGIALLLVQIAALIGNFIYLFLHTKLQISTKKLLIFQLSILTILCIFPIVLMRTIWEVLLMSFIYGLRMLCFY